MEKFQEKGNSKLNDAGFSDTSDWKSFVGQLIMK